MLNKLLKYDLKYMLKSISIFYILVLFFSITTRILFSLEQTVIVNFVGQVSVGCMFSMMASTLINTFMRSFVRFKDSLYGDESYLTHTLPVTKNNIYQSKFLLTLIYLLAGFLVVVIGLFIAYYTEERWLLVKDLINGISGNFNIPTIPFIIALLIILFLEFFNMIQVGYLGLILGHKKGNNKIAFSVLFGFIAYMLSQLFVVLVIFIVGLFNKDIMSIFTSSTLMNIDVIKVLIIMAISVYSTVNLIINVICVKKLNDGVNVD